jgi:hypothetical protein
MTSCVLRAENIKKAFFRLILYASYASYASFSAGPLETTT